MEQHSFIKDKTDTQIKHTKIKGSGMNTCLSNFTTEVAVKIVMYAKIWQPLLIKQIKFIIIAKRVNQYKKIIITGRKKKGERRRE